MKFKIVCASHGKVALPAGETWHFIKDEAGYYELDMADVWCPVGVGVWNEEAQMVEVVGHEFRIAIEGKWSATQIVTLKG
jgi:hypothetical protein